MDNKTYIQILCAALVLQLTTLTVYMAVKTEFVSVVYAITTVFVVGAIAVYFDE